MHGPVEWSYRAHTQRVVLLLQPREPGLVTLHLRVQRPEIQELAIGAIEGEHLLGQGEEWFRPRAYITAIHRAGPPLLANGVRTKPQHLPGIVAVLAEEAGRRRKRIGEDRFFQPGPGKAINRLQPVLDGRDLGGEPVERA